MKHTNTIKSIDISNKQLAEEIGDLYYDSLTELLEEIAKKIELDAIADKGRGRIKLAKTLNQASKRILEASKEIDKSWVICKPEVKKWLEINNELCKRNIS